jgi:hypothetical protein
MRRLLRGLLLGWAIGFAGALLGLSPYGTLLERSVGLDAERLILPQEWS